jgi:hypothetical protein
LCILFFLFLAISFSPDAPVLRGVVVVEQIVGPERHRNAEGHGELVEGDEPATQLGRSQLNINKVLKKKKRKKKRETPRR